MLDRLWETFSILLTDLPEMTLGLLDDHQEVIVVCLVIMLAYWCFLQKK
jgi:hypothetical protein